MIVDASVALKWLVIEDDSAAAEALLERSDLAAPTLIHAEVANAIWKKRRRGELTGDVDLASLPARLASLVRTIDDVPFVGRALEIGLQIDHPIYDCTYLAMAEYLDVPLVTADAKFANKLRQYDLRDRVVLLGG